MRQNRLRPAGFLLVENGLESRGSQEDTFPGSQTEWGPNAAMNRKRMVFVCGGLGYAALALATFLTGTARVAPPDGVQLLLVFGGPCAHLLWGAVTWFAVGSVLFWGSVVMAARPGASRGGWILVACVVWAASALMAFALSA